MSEPIRAGDVEGRSLSDHGTAEMAIDYALDHEPDMDPGTFLRKWREGDLSEWPEFYVWLATAEARLSSPVQGEGLGSSSPALPAGPGGPTEGQHSAGPEIRNALRLALAFAENEVEDRIAAGGAATDYSGEAQDVADTVRSALLMAEKTP